MKKSLLLLELLIGVLIVKKLRLFVLMKAKFLSPWWKSRADSNAENAIRDSMRNVAIDKGLELQERRFGETLSFELSRNKQKVFSFQIAVRSVELERPQTSAWPPILIETFVDNVA